MSLFPLPHNLFAAEALVSESPAPPNPAQPVGLAGLASGPAAEKTTAAPAGEGTATAPAADTKPTALPEPNPGGY